MRTASCLLVTIAAVMVAATSNAADPVISRLEPQGGQRGSEVTVRILGDRLAADPQGLLLNESGIELLEIKPLGDKHAQARLKLADDCPVGRHALRVRTASGLSNLVTFHVGVLPEQNEQEPNDTPEQPQVIESGVVINGVVTREDRDCFAITLAKGQRLSVEVEGLRLGREFFDSYLEVLDPTGTVVARSDDALPTHQDPSLSFNAPEAGTYVVLLRESALRGNGKCTYRLHVGDFARPAAIYPPAVQRDQPLVSKWIESADSDRISGMQLANVRDGQGQVTVTEAGEGSPTSSPVRVVDHPVVTEVEPNGQQNQATPFSTPASCAGVIGESRDSDHFRFTAKKNQTWDVRVFARTLRSPLDPVIRVFDSSGKRLAGNDDDQGKPDSYVRFRAPADGDYVVQIEDHLKRGGPDFVYAIEVAPPRPRVELTLHERRRYQATTIDVPQGNRTAVLLNAKRINVGGPLDIALEDLPAGVAVEVPRIEAGYYRVPVLLSAEASAPPAGSLASLVARREGDAPLMSVFQQQEWLVRGQNNTPMWSYWADRAPVAVTQPFPYKLRLVAPKARLVQNGSINLRVVAERFDRPDGKPFENPIRVRMLYHPPGVSSNQSLSITGEQTEIDIPVTADGRARVGEWPIVVTGEANYGGRTTVSTQIVTLRVAEPYHVLSMPKASATQGQSVAFRVGIEPQAKFDGTARCELVGLPPGVSASNVEIDSEATEAVFQLAIAADARVGRHRSVACRVVVQENGEPVTHTLRGGELVIDPAPKNKPAKGSRTASRQKVNQRASS